MSDTQVTLTAQQVVHAYHLRSMHHPQRYAAGPDTLDWSAQPDPFRHFTGAPRVGLPFTAHHHTTTFAELHLPHAIAASPIQLDTLAAMLELSFAISAWKSSPPDLWAVRCNPSSGNLHPTEAWVIARHIPGLQDGVYHYLSRDHVLELRCLFAPSTVTTPQLAIGLSSIMWREAWKYGERAFRYCQLDTGHALGALRYAAAVLGWTTHMQTSCSHHELAHVLGLDRADDYIGSETEEAECLLTIQNSDAASIFYQTPDTAHQWLGTPNRLDPYPMYRWPVIADVAQASQALAVVRTPYQPETHPPLHQLSTELSAVQLIHQRRSAQRFNRNYTLDQHTFWQLLDAVLSRDCAPWDSWPMPPRIHLLLFVHRVVDVAPGLYALPRSLQGETLMRGMLHNTFAWTKPAHCPTHLPCYLLREGSVEALSRTLNCHQAIAADSSFSLAMLAEFEQPIQQAAWHYRELYQEAGLIGQALYLHAEAVGLRGTGIGCYFDPMCHDIAGIKDERLQSVYHFTMGQALDDPRILSLPPYSVTQGTRA